MNNISHFFSNCAKVTLNGIVWIVSIFYASVLSSQSEMTLYDNLPCIQPGIKPAFQNNMPRWAKMLFQYPVNYNDIIKARKDTVLVKSPAERYFKVWEKCVRPYVDAEGNIVIPDISLLLEDMREGQTASDVALREGEMEWSFVGPKETFWLNEQGSATPPKSCPWQVNVYSFDVARTDENILYAGTETGFMNKTTDNGQSWQFIGRDYFFGGGITAVAIHPENENIVYVAAGNQMHITTDGGDRWLPLLTNDRFYADRIRIDDTQPDKIIAASSRGIFMSLDAGQTWSRIFSQRTWDVRIHPGNPDIIYAITTNGTDFRCVVSTDGGQNFNTSENFIKNIRQADGAMMAVSQANPNALWAVLLSDNNTPLLVKGEWNDNELMWENLASGQTQQLRMDNGQGYFDLVLEVSPEDENIIYVGTTTLYKSVNGGFRFSAVGGYVGDFAIHPDIQDLKILNNDVVWVATDGGMNYSSDHFSLQSHYRASVKGLMGSEFWGFDQGWNEDIVVGGRYHNGNTSIADFYGQKALRMGGAESPTGWVLKGKSRRVAFDDLGNGWILPKTAEGVPEGRFIFSKHPNMDEYGGRRSNVFQHPTYFGTVYLGEGRGLWRSEDSGIQWQLLYTFPDRVRYILNSPSDGDIIYADVVGWGLFKSEDGGMTFEHKTQATSAEYGGLFWAGKLHFDISPTDGNVIYLCQQNGTWSADKGRVLVSSDGGDTWKNWTDNIDGYLKSVVVQKDSLGQDIVYLFTIAKNNLSSKVYYRQSDMPGWTLLDNGYPAGMQVNIPKIFYRDSKIRVSGNAGVWEHPLLDNAYQPLVRPWVEKKVYPCIYDTVYFNDYSIIDQKDVTWKWEITPSPAWMEGTQMRNPRVVLGQEGSYDVELTLYKNGEAYSRKIDNMVTALTCPSIEDCSNPAYLPKNEWTLMRVSSEEINFPGRATMSFDDDPTTIWHTRWSTGSDPHPHDIEWDLGEEYEIFVLEYLTRQDGPNGRIKDFELYLSTKEGEWGLPVGSGTFINTSAPQKYELTNGIPARYVRIRALSEVNGNAWASAAEFDLVGCWSKISSVHHQEKIPHLKAFPVPSQGIFIIELPDENIHHMHLFNVGGTLVQERKVDGSGTELYLDLRDLPSGVYWVRCATVDHRYYHVKLVKE